MGVTTTTNSSATYIPITTQTLGANAASVTLSSIPGTYTDLVLVISQGTVNNGSIIRAQFNSDTGTNYSATAVTGNGTSAISNRNSSVAYVYIGGMNSGSSSTLGNNVIITNILNYSNTTTYKTVLSRTGSASVEATAVVGLWRSTAAITSITISGDNGNLLSGSVFTLYGILAA